MAVIGYSIIWNTDSLDMWRNCADVSTDEKRRQHSVIQVEGSDGRATNIQG